MARHSLLGLISAARQGMFGELDVLDAQRTLAEAKIGFVAALASRLQFVGHILLGATFQDWELWSSNRGDDSWPK
jgi:hypothetical protein